MTYFIVIPLLIFFLWVIYYSLIRKPKPLIDVNRIFPPEWKQLLQQHVLYYKNLQEMRKADFEHRILLFLAEKRINGIDTAIDDLDKLLVASSAIIPLFNYPYYNYPRLTEVNLYSTSFDDKFQTNARVEGRNTLGMIGTGFLNGIVLLSKPDLRAAFNGQRHKNNVGIHEFTHLIDKADGAVDGVPQILFDHSYVLPWLKEVKKEMAKIKNRKSDINPYALTNDAEFLAVVSEYFFDAPEKMKNKHPELYAMLSQIFKQEPEKL